MIIYLVKAQPNLSVCLSTSMHLLGYKSISEQFCRTSVNFSRETVKHRQIDDMTERQEREAERQEREAERQEREAERQEREAERQEREAERQRGRETERQRDGEQQET
jgi:hypothetical protein